MAGQVGEPLVPAADPSPGAPRDPQQRPGGHGVTRVVHSDRAASHHAHEQHVDRFVDVHGNPLTGAEDEQVDGEVWEGKTPHQPIACAGCEVARGIRQGRGVSAVARRTARTHPGPQPTLHCFGSKSVQTLHPRARVAACPTDVRPWRTSSAAPRGRLCQVDRVLPSHRAGAGPPIATAPGGAREGGRSGCGGRRASVPGGGAGPRAAPHHAAAQVPGRHSAPPHSTWISVSATGDGASTIDGHFRWSCRSAPPSRFSPEGVAVDHRMGLSCTYRMCTM